MMEMEALDLFPADSRVDAVGQLWLGECLTTALAEENGTPLYVFSAAVLRERCDAYQASLAQHYPAEWRLAYAGKAGLNVALAQFFERQGLCLDLVSDGELFVAQTAGFPAERIHFHGNNKTPAELVMALDAGVGRIVVDNAHELAWLAQLALDRGRPVSIWLRVAPGVAVDTHHYRQTGLVDSKFGFSLADGQAERALAFALASPHLELLGLHAHIGSQVYDTEPYVRTVRTLIKLAAEMQASHGFVLRELSPGGGWGVRQYPASPLAPIEPYLAAVCNAVVESCQQQEMDLPVLVIEPGRSLIAQAGVALYRVGTRKEIPDVRTYVSVDGGLADNIRPALYGAHYTAVVANQVNRPGCEKVTLAGRYCESGDVLIHDIVLPPLEAGDLVAVPMAGAYCLPLSSNYNHSRRPAVVLVDNGAAYLMQRRETFQDLVVRDRPLPAA